MSGPRPRPQAAAHPNDIPVSPDSILGRAEAEVRERIAGDATVFTPFQQAIASSFMRTDGFKIARRLLAKQPKVLDPDASVGERTLADLPTGMRPGQLLVPFLSPEGPTILYGPGGVGKGMIATWWAICLARAGHVVMVIDYEHNEHEWGRRARAMGATDEELAGIHYRAPFSTEWTATRGALIEVADYLKTDADNLDVDFLIIDSFVMATTTGDAMGGQASTQEFYAAIATIGRRCLVLAHVTGAAQRFPPRPFGSVYVHNLARETWAVEAAADMDFDISFDPKTHHLQPSLLALELRNRKMNDGPEAPNQFIVFAFYPNDTIEVSYPQPKKGSIADWVADILARSGKGMKAKELAAAIKDDRGEDVKEPSIRTAIKRDKRIRSSNDVPRIYTLATASADED